MHSISSSRLAAALFGFAMLGIGMAPTAQAAKFPPLNTPATSDRIPGKLIWADLFTTDPDAATKFYTGVLGWTAAPVEQKGRSYIIFSNGGKPVAGLAPRSVKGGTHPSRWIGYFSVADIETAVGGGDPRRGNSPCVVP